MFKKHSRGSSGFTLIELLVVIAIIGILSSVVLVSLQSSRAKARDAKRIADIDAIKTALALYYDSNNQYPDNLTALSPTFLASPPVAPNVGENYMYAVAPNHRSYHIGASMEQMNEDSVGVMSNDGDCSSLQGAVVDGTPPLCRGFSAGVTAADSSGIGGFDGTQLDKDCTGADVTGGGCYDVTP